MTKDIRNFIDKLIVQVQTNTNRVSVGKEDVIVTQKKNWQLVDWF